jgi:hypothetical protein
VLLLLDRDKKPYRRQKLLNLANSSWDNDEKRPRIEKIVDPGSYDLDIPSIFLNETIQIIR